MEHDLILQVSDTRTDPDSLSESPGGEGGFRRGLTGGWGSFVQLRTYVQVLLCTHLSVVDGPYGPRSPINSTSFDNRVVQVLTRNLRQ